ncbi:MAG: hypothetical protein R3277_06925 [Brumimicrobium sp.]|nr:hypothetical protein [Brumimicrobium sp.]
MKSLFFVLLLFAPLFSISQELDTINEVKTDTTNKKINRYGLWVLPSQAHNIFGIALGPIGSEAICNKYYTKKSHGLNIQLLGQGFFGPFYVFNTSFLYHNDTVSKIVYGDSARIKRVIHNGIMISGLGTFSEDINGISISPFISMNHKVNGISFNLFVNNIHKLNGLGIALFNSTYQTKGLQIGLVNKTNNLKGLQIGLWNVNSKRKLPFINW